MMEKAVKRETGWMQSSLCNSEHDHEHSLSTVKVITISQKECNEPIVRQTTRGCKVARRAGC